MGMHAQLSILLRWMNCNLASFCNRRIVGVLVLGEKECCEVTEKQLVQKCKSWCSFRKLSQAFPDKVGFSAPSCISIRNKHSTHC